MKARIFGINLIVVFLFLADRFLKLFFQKNPTVSYGGDFFSGILSFNFYTNTGIAFGIQLPQALITILVFTVLFFVGYLLIKEYKTKSLLNIFSLTLVFGGALSNLTDRLRFSYVIDYIDLKYFTVFNLADTMITAGVFLFGVSVFFSKDLDKKKEIS